jgi:hypothetical protein
MFSFRYFFSVFGVRFFLAWILVGILVVPLISLIVLKGTQVVRICRAPILNSLLVHS